MDGPLFCFYDCSVIIRVQSISISRSPRLPSYSVTVLQYCMSITTVGVGEIENTSWSCKYMVDTWIAASNFTSTVNK